LHDAHVHLADYDDPGAILAYSESRKMPLLAVATGIQNSKGVLKLAQKSPLVKAFVGIHPSDAVNDPDPTPLLDLGKEATGIGEIGLDPKYSSTGRTSAQAKVFEGQLEIAEKLRKPVQVHTRNAELAAIETIEGFRLRGVLLHWFEGEDLLARVASAGWFVSVGPALIYSKKLAQIASTFPREKLLVESDGPVPFSPLGGADGPFLIPSVCFKLALLWGLAYDETLVQLQNNLRSFLDDGKG
jgi:TatD DNase family protein